MRGFRGRELDKTQTIQNCLTNLRKAGDRSKNIESDTLLSAENIKMRTQYVWNWFDKVWTYERREQRRKEVIDFFTEEFPILKEKASGDNDSIKRELQQLLFDECSFGSNIKYSVLEADYYNILFDSTEDFYNCTLVHTKQRKMGFGVEVVSFVPDETDILIIKELLKKQPEKTQQVFNNLKRPIFGMPTYVPKIGNTKMPEKVANFIIHKRLSETAELLGTDFSEFEQVYNKVLDTKKPQQVENNYTITPLTMKYFYQGVEKQFFKYVAVAPLRDINSEFAPC